MSRRRKINIVRPKISFEEEAEINSELRKLGWKIGASTKNMSEKDSKYIKSLLHRLAECGKNPKLAHENKIPDEVLIRAYEEICKDLEQLGCRKGFSTRNMSKEDKAKVKTCMKELSALDRAPRLKPKEKEIKVIKNPRVGPTKVSE